jgi:hypothetical protein
MEISCNILKLHNVHHSLVIISIYEDKLIQTVSMYQ